MRRESSEKNIQEESDHYYGFGGDDCGSRVHQLFGLQTENHRCCLPGGDGGYQAAVDMDSVLEDIESLDGDITDETATDPAMQEDQQTADASAGEESQEEGTSETPGEAVLTGASTYMAQARIDREQIRSQNKETLLEIINNSELTEEERQAAVASMVSMTDAVEKEAAAELLLEAKGFENVVVNLTGDTVDVVVPDTQVDDASRAQIEDIVKRKTGVEAQNIVITPMSQAQDASGTGEETADDGAEETDAAAEDAGGTAETAADGTEGTGEEAAE